MATPADIQNQTLAAIDAAYTALTTVAFMSSVNSQPPAVKQDASGKRLALEQARMKLGNAILADITAQLVANERSLTKATNSLNAALGDLTEVVAVLTAIGSLLAAVGQVVPLV